MSSATTAQNDIEDPVELMLRKTGCIDLHYQVQECIASTGDWRACKEIVQRFKACMHKYTEEQKQKYAHLN